MPKKQTSIRMEIDHLTEAAELRPYLQQTDPFKRRWTQHDVIRAAISEGLTVLREKVYQQVKQMERAERKRGGTGGGKVPRKGGK